MVTFVGARKDAFILKILEIRSKTAKMLFSKKISIKIKMLRTKLVADIDEETQNVIVKLFSYGEHNVNTRNMVNYSQNRIFGQN